MPPAARRNSAAKILRHTPLLVLSLSLFLPGCANFDQLTGKAALNSKIEQLNSEKAELNSENAKLNKRITELEKTLETEKSRGKGIRIALFGGDIMYEVETNAYADVRAAFRLRAVRDRNFEESFNQFEQGKGGDSQILTLLREIDKDKDRFITNAEGNDFRRGEEASFYQGDKTVSN